MLVFKVHRLVVVDEEDKVTGIISLSDLLQYIALRPLEESVLEKTLHSISIDESEENQNSSDEKELDKESEEQSVETVEDVEDCKFDTSKEDNSESNNN